MGYIDRDAQGGPKGQTKDKGMSSSAIEKVLEASAFPEEETGVSEFTEYALL